MTDAVEIEATEGNEPEAPPEEIKTDQTQNIPGYGFSLEVHEGVFNPNQVRLLCYGESGVGKTVFASTWPKVLFLDIDNGMASIRKKVHRIAISSWPILENAVTFLERETTPFKTIVVDSVNELQSLSMRTIVQSFPGIRRAYQDLPSQSDYGKMLDEFEKMIRRLKSLSKNVVFLANVAPQEYETDVVQPQLVGKHSARNLCRMMDVVGYLYKQESGSQSEGGKQRIMIFDASKYVSKDRSGVLPAAVQDPTYRALYTFWQTRT